MLAVVLAAGLGSRMAPLTPERPKALLPTLDAPQLVWLLAALEQAGVDHAWVNTHGEGADLVREAVGRESSRRAMTISVSDEGSEPLGTAGALRALRNELTAAFLVANADVATDFPVERLVEAHRSARSPATLLAIPVEDAADFVLEESWVIDLVDRREQVRSGHRYGGLAVFEPSVLDTIPAGPSGLYETVMTPLVTAHQGLAAVEWDGYWLDIAAPLDHLQANLDVLAGMRDPKLAASAVGEACERWDVMAYVGEGATADDVDLRHSVVGRRATVAAGSHLERCIVWPGAHLPRGEYRDTVVTPTRVLPLRQGHHRSHDLPEEGTTRP
ncbi:MAG TPA: NDP-sugar synthase [Actinomycetota bacterium]|nr:NDP-sugar synthase [Actinomycetota bacterium]